MIKINQTKYLLFAIIGCAGFFLPFALIGDTIVENPIYFFLLVLFLFLMLALLLYGAVKYSICRWGKNQVQNDKSYSYEDIQKSEKETIYKLNCRNMTVKMMIDNYDTFVKINEMEYGRDPFYSNIEKLILTAALAYLKKDNELSIRDVPNLIKDKKFENFVYFGSTPLSVLPKDNKSELIQDAMANIDLLIKRLITTDIELEFVLSNDK